MLYSSCSAVSSELKLRNFCQEHSLMQAIELLQIIQEARTGDVIGEIGVLCYKPQLFTARTKRLCQLLRINRTSFLSLIQSNVGDGTVIMNNLLQVATQMMLQTIYTVTVTITQCNYASLILSFKSNAAAANATEFLAC